MNLSLTIKEGSLQVSGSTDYPRRSYCVQLRAIMHEGGSMGGLSVETTFKDGVCQNSTTEFQQGFH